MRLRKHELLPEPIYFDIKKCPRCHGEHENVLLQPFQKVSEIQDGLKATHWAMCPTTNEPIMGNNSALDKDKGWGKRSNLEKKIKDLEDSIERLDLADPEEVSSEEYQLLLNELVKLRKLKDPEHLT